MNGASWTKPRNWVYWGVSVFTMEREQGRLNQWRKEFGYINHGTYQNNIATIDYYYLMSRSIGTYRDKIT